MLDSAIIIEIPINYQFIFANSDKTGTQKFTGKNLKKKKSRINFKIKKRRNEIESLTAKTKDLYLLIGELEHALSLSRSSTPTLLGPVFGEGRGKST